MCSAIKSKNDRYCEMEYETSSTAVDARSTKNIQLRMIPQLPQFTGGIVSDSAISGVNNHRGMQPDLPVLIYKRHLSVFCVYL